MKVFLCKVMSGDVKLSEEHSAFDWIPIEDSKEKISEFFHGELDMYHKLTNK